MTDYNARLAPLKKGRYWRVQINWPSDPTRLVGKFDSQLEAREWINAHHGLTEPATVPTGSIPKKRIKRRFKPSAKNADWGFSAKGLEKLGIEPRSLNLLRMATGPKFVPEGLGSLLESIGDNIRRWRLAGLSQDALAERLEIDRRYISRTENGRVNLTMKMLWKFAAVLEVKASQLLHRRFLDP